MCARSTTPCQIQFADPGGGRGSKRRGSENTNMTPGDGRISPSTPGLLSSPLFHLDKVIRRLALWNALGKKKKLPGLPGPLNASISHQIELSLCFICIADRR